MNNDPQDDKKADGPAAPNSAPKPKPKHNPGYPITKAQHAAAKRMDKTVIKRMRKR